MAGLLNIVQGGRIRANVQVEASQTWDRGQLVYIDSTGVMRKYDGRHGVAAMVALEKAVASTTGNPKNDTNVVIAGQTGAAIFGEALIETDNVSGTGGWGIGAKVYGDANGNFTYTSGLGVQVGVAASNPAASGRIQILFRPNLG